MKKLFIVLLSIGSSLTAFSQEKGKVEFGITAGLNAATAQSGVNTNSKSRVGFNAGAYGDVFFSNSWSMKVKLSYDQKGWDDGFIRNLDNGMSFQTDYRLDYLTIPVMANWHFGKTKNWYLNFGPYAGILLSAKETSFDIDLKDYMQHTDIGLAFGIGVKIPIANRLKVLFEVEGQSGFTDVFKDNTQDAVRNTKSSLNTGLVFGF